MKSKRMNTEKLWQQMTGLTLVVLLLTGCGGASTEPTTTPAPIPSTAKENGTDISTIYMRQILTGEIVPESGDQAPPKQVRKKRTTSMTRTEITKVAIQYNPSDGHAHCKFTADGWAEGGHTSGGPEPFVHMEREEIPREQIDAIWKAARAIDTSVYPLETSVIQECVECVDLLIYYEDGRVMHLSWPFGERHPDAKVQELEALISEYKVGGW
jgi:hypothetical protein